MLFLILVLLILLVLAVRSYPRVKVPVQSFADCKRVTVPSQSLSLREIVRRFVRRESLPQTKDGLYEDRFGDLEKLSRADIVEKMDRVEQLKAQIDAFEKRQKEKAEKDEADRKVAYEAEVLAKAKDMAKSASPARGPAEGQEASSRS